MEELKATIVGSILVMIGMLIGVYSTDPAERNHKKAICEQELPRNQKCVMQFVPETLEIKEK